MKTLFTTREAAAILGASHRTLETWRTIPDHPLKFLRARSGQVMYTQDDLREYMASTDAPKHIQFHLEKVA